MHLFDFHYTSNRATTGKIEQTNPQEVRVSHHFKSSQNWKSHMIDDVLNFWFNQLTKKDWWEKSAELDNQISDQFGGLHQRALASELFSWRESAKGALAEIIVLDQFSRNIYRDDWRAFAADPLALALAQEAVRKGQDKVLEKQQRHFLYMPYMHSESQLIHEVALPLFKRLEDEDILNFELRHKEIIGRFGRYPHRNKILNRPSTIAETEFLKTPNSSF